MSALAVLDRTLADSNDRESWLNVHDKVIGSSAAGKFAKPGSVETYIRQIIAPRTFSGNGSTDRGNLWEPALLAAANARPNSLLIHHPNNDRFACTVDGTKPTFNSFAIVETKTKNERIITEPTPYEVRQLAWQLYCLPEADHAEWWWGEIVRDPKSPDGWKLRRPPQHLVFYRDTPVIIAATSLIVPIAMAVLERLDAASRVAVPF